MMESRLCTFYFLPSSTSTLTNPSSLFM
jgi:hypothetical protein